MSDPSVIVNPPKQPLLSIRRLAIVGILVVAIGVLVFANHRSSSTEGGGTGCVNSAVAGFDPCPGSRVLRQAQVGVELIGGYDGRISINGIPIPEEQMQGAILPGTEAYDQLTPDQKALGPRPNNKNIVKYQPHKGKVVEELNGEVHVTIRYWKIADGEESAQTLDYTIFVT